MDYLNYRNQVKKQPTQKDFGTVQKQQPKKPQPQSFGLDKNDVKLTKGDFKFGNLIDEKPNLPQPVSSPPPHLQIDKDTQNLLNKDELVHVFPTPVLVSKCTFDYSREEKWCCDYADTKDNGLYEVNNENRHKLKHHNRQSKDTFILDNPELKSIRTFIQEKLDYYASKIYNFVDDLVITQSWLNKNGKGELHHQHHHPNSIISGVWYPVIHDGLPPIRFTKTEERDISMTIRKGGFNFFNSHNFNMKLNKGELILFPSYLKHSVPPNQSDEERISLSFNTWSKGSLGQKEHLTYLPLDRCV